MARQVADRWEDGCVSLCLSLSLPVCLSGNQRRRPGRYVVHGADKWEDRFNTLLGEQLQAAAAAAAAGGGGWMAPDALAEFPEAVLAAKAAQLYHSVPILRGGGGESAAGGGGGGGGSGGVVAVHVSGSALPEDPKSSLAIAAAVGQALAWHPGVVLTTGGFAGIGEAAGRAMYVALGEAAAARAAAASAAGEAGEDEEEFASIDFRAAAAYADASTASAAGGGSGDGEAPVSARRQRRWRAQRERVVHLLPERDQPINAARVGGLQVSPRMGHWGRGGWWIYV
jgi:hypothetical protein